MAVVDWGGLEMEKGNTGVVVVNTAQELRWVVVMVDKITHENRSATQEVERAEAEATEAEGPEADGETVGREAEKVEPETKKPMAGTEGVVPVVKKTAGQSWWLSAVEKAIESAAKERERMKAERERISKVAEEVSTEEGDKGCVRTRARGYSGPGKR
ncbi:hypothetical protein DFP73DRAFT_567221 [Morchella snyderi]|nr:hypothetical protein DFP73DRAFT_567221 [Morchella snyderi]